MEQNYWQTGCEGDADLAAILSSLAAGTVGAAGGVSDAATGEAVATDGAAATAIDEVVATDGAVGSADAQTEMEQHYWQTGYEEDVDLAAILSGLAAGTVNAAGGSTDGAAAVGSAADIDEVVATHGAVGSADEQIEMEQNYWQTGYEEEADLAAILSGLAAGTVSAAGGSTDGAAAVGSAADIDEVVATHGAVGRADAQIEMEQNYWQTGYEEEADLAAILSGLRGASAVATHGAAAAIDEVVATGGAGAGIGGAIATGGGAAGGSDVGAASNPSSKKRKIFRHTQQRTNALEMYFKQNSHPNELERNELAQSLGMHPVQVLCWFQNKRTQMRGQSKRGANEVLRSKNNELQAEIQYYTELLNNNICLECSVNCRQHETAEDIELRAENIRLKEEAEHLRLALERYMASQNQQSLPTTFQDSQNPSTSQNPQNNPMAIQNPENIQMISQIPQDLAIPMQNPGDLLPQNPQDLHKHA